MCDEQFDLSLKEKQLFEKKQEIRARAKKYYQNLLYNPYRKADGVPFDPAIHRFNAMSAYHIENYVPKKKHIFSFIMLYFGIPAIFTVFHIRRNAKIEKAIRSGQVSYEERKTFVQ